MDRKQEYRQYLEEERQRALAQLPVPLPLAPALASPEQGTWRAFTEWLGLERLKLISQFEGADTTDERVFLTYAIGVRQQLRTLSRVGMLPALATQALEDAAVVDNQFQDMANGPVPEDFDTETLDNAADFGEDSAV